MFKEVLLVSFLLPLVQPSKILCLLPLGGKSHEHVFIPVVNELLSRGHDLTVVWPDQPPITHSKLQSISILQTQMRETERLRSIYDTVETSPLIFFKTFTSFVLPSCENFVRNNQVQNLIKTGEKFDIVIISGFMNECAVTIAPLLSNKSMILSPNVIMPWTPFDVPRMASYVPNMMVEYTDDMSFSQRIRNLFYAFGIRAVHDYNIIPAVHEVIFKYVRQDLTFEDGMKTVSLILTNVDPILITLRPTMSNVINVGGVHCRRAKPLPKEFDDFIASSANDGFILFSLGSNAQSKYLPPEKFTAILNTFSRLKQKVIWKYEDNLDKELPPNVKISKWLPQQDLLGDPRIRLFITHGGLLSLQQAVYHGVAVIGIPLFSDQPANIARVTQLKTGVGLSFNNITQENFYNVIKILLDDPSYAKNAKTYSEIFRDRLEDPVQTAVYWIEYTIRHKGAAHLISGSCYLNFLQYFVIDVVFLVIVVGLFVIIFSKFLWRVLNSLNSGGKSKKS